MSSPPPVAIAIVSFNTRDLLATCLDHVRAAEPSTIVVVDNASTDGTRQLLESASDVVAVLNEDNRGYGAAANQAVAACEEELVLLLNSDAWPAPDSLGALGRYAADHPDAAIIGPRLISEDGSLQRSTYPFPTAGDLLLGESGLHLLVRRLPGLRERFLRTWAHDRARAVPWVLGAALLLRRSAFLDLGGFDESYFLYSEEIDLSRRAKAAGYETHFAPVADVVHLGGGSSRDRAALQVQLVRSRARYLGAHDPARAARVLRTLRAIALARVARDAALGALRRDVPSRERARRHAREGWALVTDPSVWSR